MFFKGACLGQPGHIQCCINKRHLRVVDKKKNSINPKALCPSEYTLDLQSAKTCKFTKGETAPVKPNTFDNGKDNAHGRQLNRRVEVHRVRDSDHCKRCKGIIISHGKQSYKESDFTNVALQTRCYELDSACVYRSKTENRKTLDAFLRDHLQQCNISNTTKTHIFLKRKTLLQSSWYQNTKDLSS